MTLPHSIPIAPYSEIHHIAAMRILLLLLILFPSTHADNSQPSPQQGNWQKSYIYTPHPQDPGLIMQLPVLRLNMPNMVHARLDYPGPDETTSITVTQLQPDSATLQTTHIAYPPDFDRLTPTPPGGLIR